MEAGRTEADLAQARSRADAPSGERGSTHPVLGPATDAAVAAGTSRRARTLGRLAHWPVTTFLVVDSLMLAGAAIAASAVPLAGAREPGAAWALFFSLTAVSLLAVRGAYARRFRLQPLDDVAHVLGAVGLTAMALISVRVLATGDGSLAASVAGQAAYAGALLAAGRVSLFVLLRRALSERVVSRPTLILGAGKVGNLTASRLLAHPELGLDPVGFLDDDPLEIPGEPPVVPVLGGPPDLDRIVEEHHIEHFIVGFSMASHQLMLSLVRRCWELGVAVSLVPRLFEVEGSRTVVDRLGALPLVSLNTAPSAGFALGVKYAFDRLMAALALVALSPVLGAVALSIKLSMGGPVLYRQYRVGRDGRHFVMWKFRTMRSTPEQEGEADAHWAETIARAGSAHPPASENGASVVPIHDRRTPLGRLLRRLSIDELPQLWNVLNGEMSLVGPRPERVHYVEKFEDAIYRYRDRHRVKSGLTGWAQVNGLRGETSLADRVEWDNFYIENWSLWLDLKIMLRTVACLFRDARMQAASRGDVHEGASRQAPALDAQGYGTRRRRAARRASREGVR